MGSASHNRLAPTGVRNRGLRAPISSHFTRGGPREIEECGSGDIREHSPRRRQSDDERGACHTAEGPDARSRRRLGKSAGSSRRYMRRYMRSTSAYGHSPAGTMTCRTVCSSRSISRWSSFCGSGVGVVARFGVRAHAFPVVFREGGVARLRNRHGLRRSSCVGRGPRRRLELSLPHPSARAASAMKGLFEVLPGRPGHGGMRVCAYLRTGERRIRGPNSPANPGIRRSMYVVVYAVLGRSRAPRAYRQPVP